MGIKHKSRYSVGQRVNDRFTLLSNFSRKTTIKGKDEWLWECRCDCGNIFTSRESVLINRYGCHSCTNKKTSTETSFRKRGGILHLGLKTRLFKDYRVGASKRGLDFELSFEQFLELLSGDCTYCGEHPELHPYEIQYMQKTQVPYVHNGIDRVDTTKGYTLENCVSCCAKCNYAKHRMSVDEFKSWVSKVYNHLISSSTTIPQGSTLQANGNGNSENPTLD